MTKAPAAAPVSVYVSVASPCCLPVTGSPTAVPDGEFSATERDSTARPVMVTVREARPP